MTDGEQGESRRIKALVINGSQVLAAETVVLAIGHSARDTFETLLARGIPMEPKAFAVGLRVQHPQTLINESQYGIKECGELGPASYKLTWKSSDERGVYSFCMCPGGYVVNASSEPGRLMCIRDRPWSSTWRRWRCSLWYLRWKFTAWCLPISYLPL